MKASTAAAFLLLFASLPASAAWRSERVFAGGSSSYSSIAEDPAGEPAIAHGRDGLHLARWDGAAWVDEVVDPGVCVDDVSLAFDAAGSPAIAYHSFEASELRFARREALGWRIETVALRGGTSCSLAFDAAGAPAIAYGTYPQWAQGLGSESVWIARRGPGGWTSEAIESSVYPDRMVLRFDPAGRAAVAYVASFAVRLARHDGATWSIAPIAAVPFAPLVADVDFRFDAAGTPVFACATGDMWYGTGAGAVPWQIVDIGATTARLALDAAGVPRVAYETSLRGLRLARPGGPFGWTAEDVAASAALADLALTASGETLLSFREDATAPGQLVVARESAGWATTTIASDGPGMSWFSFALSPAGVPSLAFADASAGALLLARRSAGAWSYETAIAGPYDHPALAYDPAGRPAIVARRSGVAPEIALARHDGSAWTLEPLGRDLAIDRRALAFDAVGEPAVSGIDGQGRLVLLRHSVAGWSEEVAAAPASGGGALRFDLAGFPLIAFVQSGQLRLARGSAAGFRVEDVYSPPAGGVASDVDLELDGSGLAAIALAHTPAYFGMTYLARSGAPAWSLIAAAPGRATATLAFDAAGNPVIAGQVNAWTNGPPWVARWDGAGFIAETVDPLHDASRVELGIDPSGGAHLAYDDAARGVLLYAFDDGTLLLHRGSVGSLAPGWQAAALPLDAGNDDEVGGFPVPANIASWALDDPTPAAPLVLYRALEPTGGEGGNVLQAIKRGAGVRLLY